MPTASLLPPRLTRRQTLDRVRMAGYHGDRARATRLYVEGRAAIGAVQLAYAEGERAKAAGVRCACRKCSR